MDFLITSYDIHQGYPLIVFYAIGLAGFLLVVVRPYWAFLFAVFCLAARNFHYAVFTRVPSLGMYCNLNDLLVWIALLAMVRLAFQERDLWAPRILVAILAIIFIGAFQSLYEYGFIVHVQRSIWAVAIFPAMFLVAANIVSSPGKARQFYWALLAGALVAACQHLLFIDYQFANNGPLAQESDIRTISYLGSGGVYLAVSSIFLDIRRLVQRWLSGLIWLGVIVLIVLSNVLSFTRGLYVGAAFSIIGVWLTTSWQESRVLYRSASALFCLFLVIACTITISGTLFPELNLEGMVTKKMSFLEHRDVFDKAYATREQGLETETDLWLDGSIIWGVGTALPPSLVKGTNASVDVTGALGHVAFSTYLVHFGLVGLLVFGVLLPLMTIKTGNMLFRGHSRDYIGAVALAAMAISFFDVATLLTSNHYLTATTQVPGLIYGALWGLVRAETSHKEGILVKPKPKTFNMKAKKYVSP
jgi:hypothetical protein